MKRKLLYVSSFLVLVALMVIYACQKESSTAVVDNSPFNANSVEKNAFVATTTFDELNDFAQSGFDSNGLKALSLTFGSCPSIGVNLSTLPYSIVIDFGTGCTDGNGVARSGKIELSLSGLMSEKNSVATMTIANYTVDDKKITGTTKITYQGPNPGNNWPRYSVVSDGKIEFADKSVVSYHSESVRLQAEGAGTPSITDDLWRTEIQNANGVNKDGTTWTAKTTKVMIKKGDCKWYNSGTLQITPSKGDIRTIDFGDGTCDNKATLTVGTTVTNITL